MPGLQFDQHATHMEAIRQSALAAGNASALVSSHLAIDEGQLWAGGHPVRLQPGSRIFMVALGKASPAMCQAAASKLGLHLASGVAAVPRTYQGNTPECLRYYPAGHPLPDQGSLAAGAATAELLGAATAEDVVVVLISGGGSAMLELPLPGISLTDIRSLNDLLLRSGAATHEINTVRECVSLIKAGGLARMASPARVVGLILSDVIGNRLSAVASGPTVPRAVRRAAAVTVLQRHGLWSLTPQSIRDALTRPVPRLCPSPRPLNILIGTNRLVAEAAMRQAMALGFPSKIGTLRMRGEASEVGRRLATYVCRAARPRCLILAGETTVVVRTAKPGGRNQELALSAAIQLQATPAVAIMALATDGIDGTTDAAGALVTHQTVARAKAAGMDPQSALAVNDAHSILQASEALIHTGPTGTNLGDLVVALTYA